MAVPSILVFSGSARSGSYNGKLASLAAAELAALGAKVKRISLRDYDLPLYDGDLEAAEGVPEAAKALRAQLWAHDAVFIASPEYNSGYSPLLKNSLDWASRGVSKPLLAGKLAALGGASPSWRGGLRGLIQARSMLELGLGAFVIPDMVMITHANEAFDEAGALKDEGQSKQLKTAAERLVLEAGRAAAAH